MNRRYSLQEYVVRACGTLHQGVDYFLGKFPPVRHCSNAKYWQAEAMILHFFSLSIERDDLQAFTDFRNKKNGWQLHRQEVDSRARLRGPELK